MKKDKTVRNEERSAAIKSFIKSLIAPVIVLLLVIGVVVSVRATKTEEEEEEIIELQAFSGDESSEYVLESDKLKLTMDAQTHFSIEVKDTGAMWYSNPVDADSDPIALTLEKQKLQSTLIIYYSTQNGVDTLFNNYAYSIERGIYDIEQGDDYIKVYYSIGDTEKEFMIPTVISAERMEAYIAKMDSDAEKRTKDYYKKYDINKLGKKDNKEELLEKYPMLADTVIYVLRETAKDGIKTKLAEYFAAAGYTMEEYLEDKELASGESVSKKPVFNVNVVYRLVGNELQVEIPLDEIEYKSNYPLYSLCVLPYFGAGSTADEGYLFVPEGGGAKINFNNGKIAQNRYFADLYGWDWAQNREDYVHQTQVYFNAFGIANNGSSFLCTLEDGAPYASVAADISGKENSYNYTYAQYTLIHRDTYEMGSRYEGTLYVYEDGIPNEKITQTYRFADTDDYSELASIYRDYLIDETGDYLKANDDTSVPTLIEFVGAVDKITQVCGVPVSRPLKLTTFAESQAILEQLKSEGVDNMSVKLSGWANGGVQQKMLSRIKPVSSLGGKKALKNLTKYANDNGIDLYLNGITDYAYDSNLLDGFFVFTDSAREVNKQKAEIHPYSTVTFAKRDKQTPHYLLKASLAQQMVDNLVDAADGYGAYVSFEELGKELNSDYNRKDTVTRQTVLNNQVDKLKSIKDDGMQVMINMGNNYAAGYSDLITNMDLSGSTYSLLDATVPVYQMAIHGLVNYTGESLNLTQNCEEELLKSAEYGAGLSFTFMDETAFTLQNTLYTQYFGAEYDAWHDKMIDIYTRYNEELGHTFNQKMVDHCYVTKTLTCTTYEDGTRVYVNYSYDTATTPEGVSIPAREYYVAR